jgi:two-component system, NarL family, nitrate/nitrite response regulator NarL
MTEDVSTAAAAPILIFLVCPVRLYREAIAAMLAAEADLSLRGCADPDDEFFAAYDATAPDVVLLDTGTPGSLGIATELMRLRPLARVLGFGVHDLPAHVIACAEAGLAGYVPNTASVADLVTAARRIALGGTVCSAAIADDLFRHVRGTALWHHTVRPEAALTPRQRQIVRLMAYGLSNKEIARRLSLGTSTVKNHVHEILDRLHVSSRAQVASCMHPGSRAGPAPVPLAGADGGS